MKRFFLAITVSVVVWPTCAWASGSGEGHAMLEVAQFCLQLAVILLAAKLGGEVAERYLKQPAVLGELVVGAIIGPFALGGYLVIPGMGPLFPPPQVIGEIPVNKVLFSVSQIAAVILLFMAGLETNLKQFLRFAGPATLIAIGGVVFPFFFGAWLTTAFGYADTFMDPQALFMGAIMTATSVGITARILSDIKQLDTPEGVTILAGAVVDDVLGILVLSMVVALSRLGIEGGELPLGKLGWIAAKAIGFWVGIMGLGLLFSRQIEKVLNWFRSRGSALVLSLVLCFVAAALAEFMGLAMIIGAYAMGLALSGRKIAHDLTHALEPVYQFLVPVFFVVTGMFVDFAAMQGVLLFGAVLSLLAILSKIFGCGIPAWMLNFNRVGSLRIGIGMVPRGEVALIVAQIGIAAGIINTQIYGVAILMTLATTLFAPVFLTPAFLRGGSGLKKGGEDG